MQPNPLVSFVTPFFNTREYLAECIESVLRQTYQDWEYILVDNQSKDGSNEIAKSYASRFPEKIRLIRTEKFLTQVQNVGSSRVDLQACKLEYSIVSPK